MIITLKRAGVCAQCGKTLEAGTRAKWYRSSGTIYCLDHKDERPYAEQIESKIARAEFRQERREGRAERLQDEASRRFDEAHRLASIMQGEPIKIGHHSEGRHRRDIARMDTNMEKGVLAHEEAEATLEAAEGSRRFVEHMERPDVIKRRIDKFETDRRYIQRRLDIAETKLAKGVYVDWRTEQEVVMTDANKAAYQYNIERDRASIAEIQEKIDYWQNFLREAGVTFFGPKDFRKGDVVLCRKHGKAIVRRVNPKSLTLRYCNPAIAGWDMKAGYEDIIRREEVS
jgi:hypothetical protein